MAASGEVDLDLSRPSPPLSLPYLHLRSPPPSHSSPLLDLDLRDAAVARVSSSSVCSRLVFRFQQAIFFVALVFL